MTHGALKLLEILLLGGSIAFLFFCIMLALKVWNPAQRNIGVNDISDILHKALIRHEDGGITKLQHRRSDAWFSYERLEGKDDSAVLALRIPRVTWNRAGDADLNDIFGKHDFVVDTDCANESLVGRILINVDDIWDKASGSAGAYAARILMEATNMGLNDRFFVKDLGIPSKRYVENAGVRR